MLSRLIVTLLTLAFVNLASVTAFAAAISLSTEEGPPNTRTVVKGTGFEANDIVDVYFGLQQVAFSLTNGTGKFTLELRIPETALPGNQAISIIPHSGSGASAQKFFKVQTNWTQWHHDAAATGRVTFDNVLKVATVKNLGLSWRLPGGAVQSAPLLVDNSVYYVTAADGRLRSVNRYTRAPIFNVLAGADPFTAPAYGGSKVIVAANGKIKAFSSKTGELVWRADLPPGVGTPVVSDGIVYVVAEGDANAGVFAFKINCGTAGDTCNPVWHALLGSTIDPGLKRSLAVGGGNVYAVVGNKLFGLKVGCNTGGGTCTPYADWGSIRNWTPVFSNNFVFAARDGASGVDLVAFHANGPSLLPAWKGNFPNFNQNGGISVAGNQVFVPGASQLTVFPASCGTSTCAPNWQTPVLSDAFATAVAGDIVYVLTEDHVYAFPTNCSNNCRTLWQASPGGLPSFAPYISVAVADGNVYVPGNQGINVYNLNNLSGQTFVVDMAKLKPSPEFTEASSRLDVRLSAARQ